MSALDFTAIDFETANSFRGSPCSVGLVRVRSGEVVDVIHLLTRAPEQFSHFDGFNVGLHGIRPGDVASSASWAQTLVELTHYIGNDTLVCHNAGFDTGVIRYACAADGLPWPELRFLCTLVTARRTLDLLSNRLPFVAAELGVELTTHHHAADDALTAARIAVALADRFGARTLDELATAAGVYIGRMSAGQYTGSVAGLSGIGGKLSRGEANPDADPDHTFFGKQVVFTGTLMSMRRQDAWDAVSNLGGSPSANVSKKTHFLVSGDINPAVLAPGAIMTGKAAKAAGLRAAGHQIELLTEDDFIRSI